jgi:hypothetical protein
MKLLESPGMRRLRNRPNQKSVSIKIRHKSERLRIASAPDELPGRFPGSEQYMSPRKRLLSRPGKLVTKDRSRPYSEFAAW